MDWDVGIPGHIGHVHTGTAVLVNGKSRPPLGQFLNGDPALHTGEGRAQTTVNAVAESEGQAGRSIDDEIVRSVEESLIPGGRPGHQNGWESSWDGDAADHGFLYREPALVLRRRVVTQ